MSIVTAKYAIYISKIDAKITIDLKIKKLKRKMKGLSKRLTHDKEGQNE
jgi:hypothetical protein